MPPVLPAPSASLILIRENDQGAEVLVGRRRSDLRFLPGIYAFPGGRLDRDDLRPSGFAEPLNAPPPGIDYRTRRQWQRLHRGVLRETWEETGLLLGYPLIEQASSGRGVSMAIWQAYAREGLRPAFDNLRLVARAITPTSSPRRFHNRFFLADGALAQGKLQGSGEFDRLSWVSLKEALELPMGEVGTLALEQAILHRSGRIAGPGALFCWRGKGFRPRHRNHRTCLC